MCGKLFKMYTLQSHKYNHMKSQFLKTLVYQFLTLENNILLGLGFNRTQNIILYGEPAFLNNHVLAGMV